MRVRVEEKIETPITSMIDVVFLLIIFFVVTSAIEKEAVDETIKLAKSHYIPPPGKDPRQITVNVKLKDDGNYEYTIAGTGLGLPQLQSVLTSAVQRNGNDFPVIIRASGEAEYKKIDEVIAIIGKSGLYRVSLSSQDVGKQ